MIRKFNDRSLYLGQRVQCYRNLNAQDGWLFSIKDKKTGLVAAHGNCFRIENVKCHVGKGRFKVRESKRKAVHSWLEGNYTGECNMDISQLQEVYYEPYNLDHFIVKETGERLEYIDMIYFCDGKCYMNK